MQPFRSTRGGGVRAWLAPNEASLLRSLVGQVMTLIADDAPPAGDDLQTDGLGASERDRAYLGMRDQGGADVA